MAGSVKGIEINIFPLVVDTEFIMPSSILCNLYIYNSELNAMESADPLLLNIKYAEFAVKPDVV